MINTDVILNEDVMTLHAILVSPMCRKVLGVANHLGIELEIEELPPFSGATLSDEVLSLNPNGKVPILQHRDLILWESNAIIGYFCDLTPGNDLVPTDAADRADMWRWIHWDAVHFTPTLAGYFLQSFVFPHFGIGEPDEAIMASSLEKIRPLAAILDRRLEGRKFLMGEELSLADYAVANCSEHQRLGQVPLSDFSNLMGWFDRMEAVPAWSSTLPEFR